MKQLVRNHGDCDKPYLQDQSSVSHGLLPSWYESEHLYQLERRAIFSQHWMLTTHRSRFRKTGDWCRFELAGFPFLLTLDKEDNINGFHNICRHRAFPIVHEAQGRSRIFACKYHGWSYGLNGKLAKAPGYQEVGGFDKSRNGLLPVQVHVDSLGFVWIRLNASERSEDSVPIDCERPDISRQFRDCESEQLEFDHSWNMKSEHNWKFLVEHHSEHDEVEPSYFDGSDSVNTATRFRNTGDDYSKNSINKNSTLPYVVSKLSSFYRFPNAFIVLSSHLVCIQRYAPISARDCSIEYEFYRHKQSCTDAFQKDVDALKRTLMDSRWLYDNASKLVSPLVDRCDQATRPGRNWDSDNFHDSVRNALYTHWHHEQDMKEEIWPARQLLPQSETVSYEDDELCRSLSCKADKLDISW